MGMMILGVILMMTLFGGLGSAAWYVIRKTDPSKTDTSIKTEIETAQEFLPFEDFIQNMVHLGNHEYRAYLEVSSINYYLRTEDEKNLVELSFQRFINSLSHSIVFYVQTRRANNDELLEQLEQDYLKTIEQYPQLTEVAQENFEEMVNLYTEPGSDREKRKYIIVPFDEAIQLAESDDEGKRQYAAEELYQRCRVLIEGLSAIGLKSRMLNTYQIAELIFSTYHKDNYKQIQSVLEGEYGTLIVNGQNKANQLFEEGHLDWILYETQMKLQQELLNAETSPDVQRRVRLAIREVEETRNQLAGYYQNRQDDDFGLLREE